LKYLAKHFDYAQNSAARGSWRVQTSRCPNVSHFGNSYTKCPANYIRCYSSTGIPWRQELRRERFAPVPVQFRRCYGYPFARTRCLKARAEDLCSLSCGQEPAKTLLHARQKVEMEARRAHLSVLRASACGIPASTLLSALDRDKAYFLFRCVHRVPCTLNYLATRQSGRLFRPPLVIQVSPKLFNLLVRGSFYKLAVANEADRFPFQSRGFLNLSLSEV